MSQQKKYYIRAEYCYSAGTFYEPADGQWFDLDGVGVWDCKEDVQSLIDGVYDNPYYLRHGEQGRPTFKIMTVRKNQIIGTHIFKNENDKY